MTRPSDDPSWHESCERMAALTELLLTEKQTGEWVGLPFEFSSYETACVAMDYVRLRFKKLHPDMRFDWQKDPDYIAVRECRVMARAYPR
ncbi:hypothetical protein G1C95_1119 [Bifidobacterium sp. DSM 109957]|uniref:Uncharacterized protein n=2 Tax=Bifidobacterium oedipodis TaxID=2675322 RepID=A0A7Y0HTA9_9BIFI|nr:hypothetical protein [Bifidobacterium sp. DSM 109957]